MYFVGMIGNGIIGTRSVLELVVHIGDAFMHWNIAQGPAEPDACPL